jgi:hypothetical protein
MFREWKRQGYEMVLDDLKKYSQTLDSQEMRGGASAKVRTTKAQRPPVSPQRVKTPGGGHVMKPVVVSSSTGGIGGGFSANVASYSSMFQAKKKGYF